ncbi:MAG TPA: oxidoreductase [Rhodospirillaceae bacterium]|nr:oxidoreductase [Candidatus Neomarinimicrobiota bacterium]HCX15135.1 oxidoreductase [Rhodospirillaceae bacterium]|tara:strand:+ start:130 stop:1278 length:1149 start_codon:yes stop_codon:yes gene_type:complete
MAPLLFSPMALGPFEIPNRMTVAPMCQYSADDGSATAWHTHQLMNYAMSGAGIVMVEATAVERRGRLSHGCLGLYTDANEIALSQVMMDAKNVAPAGSRFGIQLAHSGRKGSVQRPWEGGRALGPSEDPWPVIASSALPFSHNYPTPAALNEEGMQTVREAFVQAALRSLRIGFDIIELHSTHGYLLDSFLSPIANQRTDEYGGSLQNRTKFPLSVAKAVRAAVPKDKVFGMRITGTDWTNDGWSTEDAANYSKSLKELGVDYLCVSSGGVAPGLPYPTGPGYQVPLAENVKAITGLPTRTAGHIVVPEYAEEILQAGRADMIALARAILDNPHWIWHAADRLGAKVCYPPQYERINPSMWKAAPIARPQDFLHEGSKRLGS